MAHLYCNSLFKYNRANTTTVKIKQLEIGGNSPVVVQSMGVVSSLEVGKAVEEALRIIKAGGEMVRFTAASIAEAKGVSQICQQIHKLGYTTPIIADVHFNPEAAFVAAMGCDKVRINPGNFVDKGEVESVSDEDMALSRQKVEESLSKLIDICNEHGTALRIGVNHGSLSHRMMTRYGDTTEGMVASAMEFLEVCNAKGFDNVVVSMKSSSTPVMVRAYRQLSLAMLERGFSYPLHLGVTEAGEGTAGRVNSAVGIGALMCDGLGDTIRVSLTEPPEDEIAVADMIVAHFAQKKGHREIIERDYKSYSPYCYQRCNVTSTPYPLPLVVGHDTDGDSSKFIFLTNDTITDGVISELQSTEDKIVVLHSSNVNCTADIRSAIFALRSGDINLPVVVKLSYDDTPKDSVIVKAAADAGIFFIDNIAQGLWIDSSSMTAGELSELALMILQAAQARITTTQYISCPGCGRTMFDIQSRVKQVKERTKGLAGLKIAVMGCIVNGPGEMAGADYGYVGAGRGKVSLYKDGAVVHKGVDEEQAIEMLLGMIEEDRR